MGATTGESGKILIVSGGTGGHIFPAIVFGRWLEREQGLSISWLCGSRPLEAEIYASAGITPLRLSLEGSPLGVRSPGVILRRSLSLLWTFGEAARFIGDIRPKVVFLFGGYVSLAPLLVCWARRIPVVLHEQNAVAGRVTRLASRLGATVTTGWSECGELKKNFIPVGIPVREPERLPRSEALKRLSLPDELAGRRIVGVVSGSLGSRPLVERLTAEAGKIQSEFLFLGKNPTETCPPNVHFVGRQWDMNPFYSLCDMLVCRAGGSTLAEALKWGIPAVAVPWKGATEGHQERNARCFAALGGGVCAEEDDSSLARAIEALLDKSPQRQALSSSNACAAIARAAGL